MGWRVILFLALAVLFLAAACRVRTPTSTPVLQPAVAQGGEFIQRGSDPPTLDPHLTTDATSATYIVEVFGGLVTLDLELQVAPDLAERWEVSRDGESYTFSLRRDARFHDGKRVTAEDVRWSLERVTNPSTQAPVVDTYLGDILGVKEKLEGRTPELAGVEVLDDSTLRITLETPTAVFLKKLTYPTAFVLDRENVEGQANWTQQPNGTGPFRLAEYVVGERLVLERNEFYHLGPPNLDRVRFILSGGNPMLLYENDEVHIAGVGLADRERVLDPANPLSEEVHLAPPDFSIQYLGMNVNQPPLDDVKVRQALNYAVNTEFMAAQLFEGLLVPAKGILPPGFPGYNPDVEGYTFDGERARQLLRESKYDLEDFPRIVITVPGAFGAAVPLDLQVVLETWRRVLGLEVEIQQVEWATFLQELNRQRLQLFAVGWIADYPDPENFLDVLFHSQSSNNQTGYANPEVDRLLERARTERDEETRIQLYRQVEEMVLRDAPWIPLWHPGETMVLLKPYVHNYPLVPLVVPTYRYIYMER
ncbi:MAG: ABC transporter substrate-binding protein [Dehalococcoidia bacterium]